MNRWHPIVRGFLAGCGAFVTATCVIILGAGQLSGWQPPSTLDPLHPQPIAQSSPQSQSPITRSAVSFAVGGRTTRGLLIAPEQGAEVGVVLVAGAGPSDRRSLLPLAEDLARSGVAVLTYDKRAVGYSALHRDYKQLADDALIAVDTLRETTGIVRIGAIGVSEGGWVVTEAAGRPGTPLSFAVLGSAPIVSPLEQISWTVDNALIETPVVIRRASATLLAGGRTVVDYLDFDSRPALAATDIPVLALWGADDATVPVTEAYLRLHTALSDRLTAHIVADTGHDLLTDTSPWLTGAVRWMRHPGGSPLTGVAPTNSKGVAVASGWSWLTDPRLHLSFSLVTAVITTLAVWQRANRRHERQMP